MNKRDTRFVTKCNEEKSIRKYGWKKNFYPKIYYPKYTWGKLPVLRYCKQGRKEEYIFSF